MMMVMMMIFRIAIRIMRTLDSNMACSSAKAWKETSMKTIFSLTRRCSMASKTWKTGDSDMRSDQAWCLWQLVRTSCSPGSLSCAERLDEEQIHQRPISEVMATRCLQLPAHAAKVSNIGYCPHWPLLNLQFIGGTGTHLDVLLSPYCA